MLNVRYLVRRLTWHGAAMGAHSMWAAVCGTWWVSVGIKPNNTLVFGTGVLNLTTIVFNNIVFITIVFITIVSIITLFALTVCITKATTHCSALVETMLVNANKDRWQHKHNICNITLIAFNAIAGNTVVVVLLLGAPLPHYLEPTCYGK